MNAESDKFCIVHKNINKRIQLKTCFLFKICITNITINISLTDFNYDILKSKRDLSEKHSIIMKLEAINTYRVAQKVMFEEKLQLLLGMTKINLMISLHNGQLYEW